MTIATRYDLTGHILFATRRFDCDGYQFVQEMHRTPQGGFVRTQDGGGHPDVDDAEEAVLPYDQVGVFQWLSEAPEQITRSVY